MAQPSEHPVVLVVADEFLIRMQAAVMIRDAGFEVVEAADADEAISILESRGDIRVVFTDIQMPGSMDGLKLAHAVKHRWPPVHIIATSAHYAALKDELPVDRVFLPKPYTEPKVIGALRALVAFP